jgi:hypothetical protein
MTLRGLMKYFSICFGRNSTLISGRIKISGDEKQGDENFREGLVLCFNC